MAGKPKIKYVQSEPAAYTADPDWVAMDGQERGCYHSLIIYLSCNNGRLFFNRDDLSKLCNTNLKDFDEFWSKYKNKFKQKGG